MQIRVDIDVVAIGKWSASKHAHLALYSWVSEHVNVVLNKYTFYAHLKMVYKGTAGM